MAEARAVGRFVPTSPRKARLMVDLIRSQSVDKALTVLHFSPKHVSRTIEKTLRSAVSNLANLENVGRVEPNEIFIKEAFVNGGPMAKRIQPAPQGRAYRVRKRSHHLTIVVATKD
jgi:large subunit ribosomal protein L22